MRVRLPSRRHIYRAISLAFALSMIVYSVVMSGMVVRAQTAGARGAPGLGGCPLFPANNIWNRDISTLPVHHNSANFVAGIGSTGHMHADFGSGLYAGAPIGIPYVIVPGNQPLVPVHFDYAAESDPGPYPIPPNVPIEGGSQSNGDRHVIVVNSGTCKVYELFSAYPQSDGSWHAGSGAVWNLNSNALRPRTWTSADAAGLPMLPGLARYDEIAAGVITHALRFTATRTQNTFIWPARHQASSNADPNLPPMGLRLRLKASFNIASFPRVDQIILTALKHYGMIVADNGTSWFVGGAPDSRWNNDQLGLLRGIQGSNFEVVDESKLQISANSAQAASSSPSAQPSPTKAAPLPTRAGITVVMSASNQANAPQDDKLKGGAVNASTSSRSMGPLLLVAGGLAVVIAGVGVWLLQKRRLGPRRGTG